MTRLAINRIASRSFPLRSKEFIQMFIMKLATAGLLGMVAVSALAQAPSMDRSADVRAGLQNGDRDSLPRSNKASNIDAADTRSNIAPTLPSSRLSLDATSREYLQSARDSLAAGRTGAAQQSLEMAETRALGGSVDADKASVQSDSTKVTQIRDALHALGSGDNAHSMQLIDVALAN
jgi:hypothetical protein